MITLPLLFWIITFLVVLSTIHIKINNVKQKHFCVWIGKFKNVGPSFSNCNIFLSTWKCHFMTAKFPSTQKCTKLKLKFEMHNNFEIINFEIIDCNTASKTRVIYVFTIPAADEYSIHLQLMRLKKSNYRKKS